MVATEWLPSGEKNMSQTADQPVAMVAVAVVLFFKSTQGCGRWWISV